MKHIFCLLIIIILLGMGLCVYAGTNRLVLVYPHNGAQISANSTFFVGNTNPNAILTINNKPVKVYKNGAYVRVFDLKNGKNTIILKSVLNKEIKIKKIELNVSPPTQSITSKQQELKSFNKIMQIVVDETPLRKTPYGERLTPVKKGVLFQPIGILNKHYKIKLENDIYGYISQNAAKPSSKTRLDLQTLDKIDFNEDEKDIIIKIPMNYPTLTEIKTSGNLLKVQLINSNLNFKNYSIKSPYIKSFTFNKDNLSIELLAERFNGYDYFYQDNIFILKIRKPFNKGLRGKTIAIDAGHGGKELGAIGPTEVPEKDINIKIAKYLKEYMELKGANVVMTRNSDEFVELYERVNIARRNNADILISIHNNALPDGKNPYITHGTSTYYYHEFAHPLAQCVQDRLLKATGFPNHGIRQGSLVLTRPSMPLSILVEVGFMINPFEYEKLLIENNQKRYAQAIAEGIENYFKL